MFFGSLLNPLALTIPSTLFPLTVLIHFIGPVPPSKVLDNTVYGVARAKVQVIGLSLFLFHLCCAFRFSFEILSNVEVGTPLQ